MFELHKPAQPARDRGLGANLLNRDLGKRQPSPNTLLRSLAAQAAAVSSLALLAVQLSPPTLQQGISNQNYVSWSSCYTAF